MHNELGKGNLTRDIFLINKMQKDKGKEKRPGEGKIRKGERKEKRKRKETNRKGKRERTRKIEKCKDRKVARREDTNLWPRGGWRKLGK